MNGRGKTNLIKFGDLKIRITTFCSYLLLQQIFHHIIMYAAFHKEFNKTYRFDKAHTEEEICTIVQTCVFCVDTNSFVNLRDVTKV